MEEMSDNSVNMVIGDLNGDISPVVIKDHNKGITKHGKMLFDFVTRYNLCAANLSDKRSGPINTFHSENGQSCIDYHLVPVENMYNIKRCSVLENEALNTSDHYPVVSFMDIGSILRNFIEVKAKKRLRWDKISKDDIQKKYAEPIKYKLSEVVDSITKEVPTESDVDNLLDKIVNILRKTESVIPTSNFRKNLRPYWGAELELLKKAEIKCYRASCDAGRPRNPEKQNCAAKTTGFA